MLGIPALFQRIGLNALASELASIPQIYDHSVEETQES